MAETVRVPRKRRPDHGFPTQAQSKNFNPKYVLAVPERAASLNHTVLSTSFRALVLTSRAGAPIDADHPAEPLTARRQGK